MLDILSISVEDGCGGAPDEVSANPLVAVQEESCVCVLRRPSLTPNVEGPNTLENTTGLQFINCFLTQPGIHRSSPPVACPCSPAL